MLNGSELFSVLVLLVVNHYLAFSYFATTWHPFAEVWSTTRVPLNSTTAVALGVQSSLLCTNRYTNLAVVFLNINSL